MQCHYSPRLQLDCIIYDERNSFIYFKCYYFCELKLLNFHKLYGIKELWVNNSGNRLILCYENQMQGIRVNSNH